MTFKMNYQNILDDSALKGLGIGSPSTCCLNSSSCIKTTPVSLELLTAEDVSIEHNRLIKIP